MHFFKFQAQVKRVQVSAIDKTDFLDICIVSIFFRQAQSRLYTVQAASLAGSLSIKKEFQVLVTNNILPAK